MKNNKQLNNQNIDNEFNNVESVETIYPAESIDIIDNVSTQIISSTQTTMEPNRVAANDLYAPGHIFSLDNARLAKKSKSTERRALKSRLTDRRSDVRISANGEPQEDRRDANRIANVEAIRLTH